MSPPSQPATKERILDATAELFRRHGYTGTGLKQIVAQANAPFGSVYHHFPGGKQQLGAEVIERAGAMYFELVAGIINAAPDIVTGVRDCFAGAAAVLAATDYADACPIETVALEVASTNETLRLITAEIFESWIESATERGRRAGLGKREARRLAFAIVSALEGAFVLSRAMKSREPLIAAGTAMVAAARAALTPANGK